MTDQQPNHPITSWSELLTRTMELGLGAASLTVETAQKVVKDLVHHGQVTEAEGESLVDRLLAMGREQRTQLEGLVNKGVEGAMERMDLARRSELASLHARVTELESMLQAHRPCEPTPPTVPEVPPTDNG